MLVQLVDKADSDIRSYASAYQERKAAANALKRTRGGNLMVANLQEVLTPELVGPDLFVNTDYLQTAVVVMQQ